MKNEGLTKALLTIASLITGLALFGIVGTQDYQDAKHAECVKNGQLYDKVKDECGVES